MQMDMNRRNFMTTMGAGAGMLLMPGCGAAGASVPSYLADYADLYKTDPREAAREWMRDSKFGLFMHYGLYSLLGRHEWVQLREIIRVDEYAKLKEQFTAKNFDADFITDMALDAGMKYINITSRHHDSFCLFGSKETDFNSVSAPNCRRDLVGELAEACAAKGLGFFLYYSHGRDWKHPHAPNGDKYGKTARPHYNPPEPSYATGDEHDLQKYVDFMSAQITELLTNYGPIAGIWLDGIGTTRAGDVDAFKAQALYDMIRAAQPQVLVSYKQGLLGTEDFFAPERDVDKVNNPENKPLEICDTLQPKGWGWVKEQDGNHKDAQYVMGMLANAAHGNSSLLLNTGPLPDGTIHPDDVATLKEVGRLIRANGFPAAAEYSSDKK
jgi:alpha-L-fucosidase